MTIAKQNQLVYESKIWDLHIHTNRCPKGTDEFKSFNNEQFIDKLIEIFDNYPTLDMISFTDHNLISYDVYEEYYSRNHRVKLIVGIEVDVMFNENVVKHLIVYFDLEREKIKNYSIELNNFLNKVPISIGDLLDFLISKKVKFALSPHAFKQGKRGVDFSWSTEEKAEQEMDKYMDQFFIFWEASGFSEISRAIQFLREMDKEERVSIISFSDSNNFNKLINYLNCPTQYFSALPNFKGMQMVGTEISRITTVKKEVESNNNGNLIGSVNFFNNMIKFTDGLNTVIGGRGSGKSLLIDAIALKLKDKTNLPAQRIEYLKRFPINVYDFNHKEIQPSFNFDYYEQSYISKLFSSKNYNEELMTYFSDAFNKVKNIDINEIKHSNRSTFISGVETYIEQSLENISAFSKKYIINKDDNMNIKIFKKDILSAKTIKYESYDEFNKKVIKAIPKELQQNSKIMNKIIELYKTILSETYLFNEDIINAVSFNNNFIELYYKIKNNKTTSLKQKNDSEDLFIKTFNEKSRVFKKRVNTINSIINASLDFKTFYQKKEYFDGVEKNAFMFSKELKVEHPLEYLYRKFKEYFHQTKTKLSFTIENLGALIDKYCFSTDDNHYISGKSSKELDIELNKFDLNYIDNNCIYYKSDDKYENIETKSPGTQTNILMEYIVYKDTNRPLLIDQPEDNIDNQTVYKILKNWFIKLKSKRQVIVVTHDANIVINADSDNIIISSQEKKDDFIYTFGALEYADNLEISSNILDGGIEAVKRRLLKYGE